MLENLNKLTKNDVNKFGKFIIFPYYNSNKEVIKLFNYLSSLHPNITKEDTNNKILFRRIFRKGSYEDIVVRRIISMYLKVFEKFLIQLEVEKIRS